MVAMFIMTSLFMIALIYTFVHFPQLRHIPKDAVVVCGVLVLAYVVAMFQASGHLHITVDSVLNIVFTFLSPSHYMGR